MTLTPQTISSGSRTTRSKKRLGRGNGSQKGTSAGKGTKGQKARAGQRGGLKLLGFKKGLQKVPKLRGFKSRFVRLEAVNISTLEKLFLDGDKVTPAILIKKGVARGSGSGIKILGEGKISKKLMIEGCVASKGAIRAIEAAGGAFSF